VRTVASRHGGGGHKNAAGFSVPGPLNAVRGGIIRELTEAIALGLQSRP
jgi:nanoRNase/pAp phosphatase (c-di-AMP/oligoRNAs hydrolase)